MALQALAQYSALSYSPEMLVDVQVMRDDVMMGDFQVDANNKMLMQKSPLQVPDTYEMRVNGSGCVFVQFSVEYNVVTQAPVQPSFELTSQVRTVDSSEGCARREINVCARFEIFNFFPPLPFLNLIFLSHVYFCRYLLGDGYSNMAVIAVKMVSGWSPDKDSVKKVRSILLSHYQIFFHLTLIYYERSMMFVPA